MSEQRIPGSGQAPAMVEPDEAVVLTAPRSRPPPGFEFCRVYWGSHGCKLVRPLAVFWRGSMHTPETSTETTGIYTATITPTLSGHWAYAFDGEGAYVAAGERKFEVRDRAVPR